jgi:3-methyladenine DNA glycosylase/8-oxoguanine DNA glycosylase
VLALRFDGALDLRRTLGPLAAGPADPTLRVAPSALWRATRTPDGPATLCLRARAEGSGGRLLARAWGPGAEWALSRAGDLAGLADPPVALEAVPAALRPFARRARGLRLARTHRVVEALVLVVLQQKVSGREAVRAFHRLHAAFAEPAPGPAGRAGLRLPLAPEQLRRLPPALFPALGILARQGETLRRLGALAERIEEAADLAPDAAEARLRAVPGLGVWSARSAALRALGHADAVPVGDWNLPAAVAFNLTGGRETRADDARMLALLEPYRGFRGRAVRWILAGGRFPPRRAPRAPLRAFGDAALAPLPTAVR